MFVDGLLDGPVAVPVRLALQAGRAFIPRQDPLHACAAAASSILVEPRAYACGRVARPCARGAAGTAQAAFATFARYPAARTAGAAARPPAADRSRTATATHGRSGAAPRSAPRCPRLRCDASVGRCTSAKVVLVTRAIWTRRQLITLPSLVVAWFGLHISWHCYPASRTSASRCGFRCSRSSDSPARHKPWGSMRCQPWLRCWPHWRLWR